MTKRKKRDGKLAKWPPNFLNTRPKPVGIFGQSRDFPLTTKEAAMKQLTQLRLW